MNKNNLMLLYVALSITYIYFYGSVCYAVLGLKGSLIGFSFIFIAMIIGLILSWEEENE